MTTNRSNYLNMANAVLSLYDSNPAASIRAYMRQNRNMNRINEYDRDKY
jgi:hypothetical protein